MNKIKFSTRICPLFCLLIFVLGVSAQKQINNVGVNPTSFVILNEIQVNNPGADLVSCEYIEVRGDANTLIDGSLYLLEVEGDGTGAGRVDVAHQLDQSVFGTNGLITITGLGGIIIPAMQKNDNFGGVITPCGNRDYSVEGANVVESPDVSLQNGTISFMLVSTTTSTISVGDDLDGDNDGTIDGLAGDAIIVDAVGWTDGGVSDFIYGGVNVSPGNTSGAPDAATRNFLNLNPIDATAWFADDIVGVNADSIGYDQTNFTGGFMIRAITPGKQNVTPVSALGVISGRARSTNGRGIKNAIITLTGGDLQEPIYATTNQFGHYNFDGIQVGQSYILQINSRRYTFQNPSRVVNLEDSITDEDFVVEDFSRKSK